MAGALPAPLHTRISALVASTPPTAPARPRSKPLKDPLPDVLPKMEYGQSLLLTVSRGITRERPVSLTVHSLHGEI